jgi:hypothetical protein
MKSVFVIATETPRSIGRGFLLAVVASGVLLGLVGCTPSDDVSARIVDKNLVFVFCGSTDFNRVTVVSADKAVKLYDWIPIWQAIGDLRIPEYGSTITYGIAPDNMINIFDPVRFILKNHFLDITADHADRGQTLGGLFGQFDGDDLSDKYWLNTVRGHQDKPCKE